MVELQESMSNVGLLNPITVLSKPPGFEILAGARRFAAAKNLKWKTIPAMVFQDPKTPVELITLHENLIREKVKVCDEARWLNAIMKSRKWNGKQLAAAIGRSEAWVSERCSLLGLPMDVVTKLDAGEIPFSAVRELMRINDPVKRATLFSYAVTGGVDTSTAKRWREDAERSNVWLEPAKPAGDKNGGPTPAKILASCEICHDPYDIGITRVLRLCIPCYEAIRDSGVKTPK